MRQHVQRYRERHTEYAQLLPRLFNAETTESERFFTGIAIHRHITGKDDAVVGGYLTRVSGAVVGALRDVIKSA